MKGLDLRKFKKLHSNENSTTLVHPDGHKISIAHKSVNEALRQQLHELPKFAEGGFVEKALQTVKEAFTEEDKSKHPKKKLAMPSEEDAKKMKKVFAGNQEYAKGGMVNGYADGGDVQDYTAGSVLDEPQINAPSLELPAQSAPDMSSMTPEQQQMTEQASAPMSLKANPVEDLKTEQATPAEDIYSQFQPKQQEQVQMTRPDLSGPADQITGLQREANAVGAMGNNEALAAQEQSKKMAALEQHYAQQSDALQKEIANVTHDVQNGHIDPNHFWNSKSDMGKIGTAIGLILGGIGGGMTHQENPALKFLNAQIDRDIDAQKMQMNSQHNLLGALEKQFGNVNDATKMAKAMYADMYTSKIAEAAAKSKDPIAQARAQQAIGQIKAATAPIMQELALKQTLKQGLKAGMLEPEQAVAHLVPKEHQKEVFGEIKRAEDARRNESAILSEFDKAAKDNTLTRRVFQHAGAEPASLANTRNMLMPVLKDNEGRINETEIKMMEDYLPKAGDSDSKIAQKRQSLQSFIQAKKSAPTAKGFGIDLESLNSTRTAPTGFNRRK